MEINEKEKNYISQKELAKRWTISQRTLENWRAKGIGPCYMKLVGRIIYRMKDIEEYENKCTHFPLTINNCMNKKAESNHMGGILL